MEKIERIVKPWYEGLEEGKILGRECSGLRACIIPPLSGVQ